MYFTVRHNLDTPMVGQQWPTKQPSFQKAFIFRLRRHK